MLCFFDRLMHVSCSFLTGRSMHVPFLGKLMHMPFRFDRLMHVTCFRDFIFRFSLLVFFFLLFPW